MNTQTHRITTGPRRLASLLALGLAAVLAAPFALPGEAAAGERERHHDRDDRRHHGRDDRHDHRRDFDRHHRHDHPVYRPGRRLPPPHISHGRHFKHPPYYYRGRYYAYPPHHRGHFRPIYNHDGSIRMWIELGF